MKKPLFYGAGPSQGLKIRGGHVILGGDNVPPLVEIGLTDLPKSGPPACDGPALFILKFPDL